MYIHVYTYEFGGYRFVYVLHTRKIAVIISMTKVSQCAENASQAPGGILLLALGAAP
jgi:hypothetical protein